MKITLKVQQFIDLIVDGKSSLTEAYEQSFDCSRMKRPTIAQLAWKLSRDPVVSDEIERRRAEARERSIISVSDVANEFARVAFSDPGAIVQHRRLCCRFCYGVAHEYQWKNGKEYDEAVRIWEDDEAKRLAVKGKKTRPRARPDESGGYGFEFNRPPHAQCPECMGEGKPDVFIVDTTRLTPEQRRTIERIRVTKDGVEVRLHNTMDALAKVGQMLGGFKQTVVLQNPDGTPVQGAPTLVTLSPEDAATKYKEWMDSKK